MHFVARPIQITRQEMEELKALERRRSNISKSLSQRVEVVLLAAKGFNNAGRKGSGDYSCNSKLITRRFW